MRATKAVNNRRLYQTWLGMKARCNNPAHKTYDLYGGKGITVCDDWLTFDNFADWALKNGYTANAPYGECTIDRIDTSRGYEPDNCRWVNAKTQSRNRSNIKPITFNGKTQLMTDWAKEYGIPLTTLYIRLSRGCSIETALTQKRLKRGAR